MIEKKNIKWKRKYCTRCYSKRICN